MDLSIYDHIFKEPWLENQKKRRSEANKKYYQKKKNNSKNSRNDVNEFAQLTHEYIYVSKLFG